jgi:hypothetical protein
MIRKKFYNSKFNAKKDATSNCFLWRFLFAICLLFLFSTISLAGTTYNLSDYYPLGQGDRWIYGRPIVENNQVDYYSYTYRIVDGTESYSGQDLIKRKQKQYIEILDLNVDSPNFWSSPYGEGDEYELLKRDGNNNTLFFLWTAYASDTEVYSPYQTVLPSELSMGQQFTQNFDWTTYYSEGTPDISTTHISETIILEAVEDVIVQNRGFKDCLRIAQNWSSLSSSIEWNTKYWLAQGVGIVKQTKSVLWGNEVLEDRETELLAAYVGGRYYGEWSSFNPAITLTISKNGPGVGSVTSSDGNINCGNDCSENCDANSTILLTATPDTGSTFGGWSGGGCSGTGSCSVVCNSDTTVTATFNAVPTYTYTITPTNKSFKANGGNLSTKVTGIGQNCPAPLVTINDAWLSQSGAMSWKNNAGTVKIAIQKNTSSQSRTGVIWIGGNALTIEEDGAPCQLTALKPSSEKFANGASTGSFNILVSTQDCAWNITTTSNWIHLDTSAGTGNGNVAFHIDANTTGKNRTGKIDASLATDVKKKKTFSVKQSK